MTFLKRNSFYLYGFISLLLSVFTFCLGLYFYLCNDLEETAKATEKALHQRMQSISVELKEAADAATLSCEGPDIQRLQVKAFRSPIFKEFGLFDENFRVYCTGFGVKDISIYSTIADRIKSSKDNTTVSLINSYSFREPTFIAFYLGENGIGANALASPKSLSIDIDYLLSPNYQYKLTLGKSALVSSEIDDESTILDTKKVFLDDWSMQLETFLPSSTYWNYATSSWPLIIVLWLIFLFVFYVFHWSFLYYFCSLSHGVKRAIKNNQMEVYYQPILSLKDNSMHDMEALVRWQSSYHGQVSALSIVETATRLGVIDDLTWMVIRKVGRFYRSNPELLENVVTAVNVDRFSLLNDSFIPTLTRILEEYPELKGKLDLEVTETSALSSVELPLVVKRFEDIKALDIRLSVDDFGTGYAGLDFLRRFPYDTLKLDRVFIASLKEDPFTQQVLSSITKLAKELKMKIVAEGVENKEQLVAVQTLGVDYVQGYYFCTPLPKDQVVTWIEDHMRHKAMDAKLSS